jgi:hypothetical protein
MNHPKKQQIVLLITITLLLVASIARADVVTDWKFKVNAMIVEAKLGPAPGWRVLAVVDTAVYEAVNAITGRYPASGLQMESAPGASVEAAVASATHATLTKRLPSQRAAIDNAYQTALAMIADSPAKTAGIAVGEKAAGAILAWRADDDIKMEETYRPYTTAGVYVPTDIPVVSQWPRCKPWLMTSPSQFRPGPPPDLSSEAWAKDYNEIKELGGKYSMHRSAEQTAMALFWQATLPPIYQGVVHSVADVPGREMTQNARLFAAVAQAADDALIAVFEAKYHYHFWRPITAIRNGDIDDNNATERDPSWTPLINTPMHPEYPCAHCIVSGAIGTVLQAEIGTGPVPTLTTTSSAANGTARSWTTTDDFMQEVAQARIYDGVHYRFSTEVGTAMGKQIGELAVAKYLRPLL